MSLLSSDTLKMQAFLFLFFFFRVCSPKGVMVPGVLAESVETGDKNRGACQ